MQELNVQELEVVSGGNGHTVTTVAPRTTTSTLTVAKDPGDRN